LPGFHFHAAARAVFDMHWTARALLDRSDGSLLMDTQIVQHPGDKVDAALQDATTSTQPIMLLPRTTPATASARRSASASATRRSG
jgi:hypothetical protein